MVLSDNINVYVYLYIYIYQLKTGFLYVVMESTHDIRKLYLLRIPLCHKSSNHSHAFHKCANDLHLAYCSRCQRSCFDSLTRSWEIFSDWEDTAEVAHACNGPDQDEGFRSLICWASFVDIFQELSCFFAETSVISVKSHLHPAFAKVSVKSINSSPPGQNGHHFADDIFWSIFMNEKFCILIEISLKFVPMGPIDNNPALI